MGEVILIFIAMAFSGIAAVLCLQVQRLEEYLKDIREALLKQALISQESRDTLKEMVSQTQKVAALPSGFYLPGDPAGNGLTPLVSLKDDRRS